MFIPARPKCDWGIINDAYVPSTTFCHLTLKNNYDNSRFSLGSYQNGFWMQNQTQSLPFLIESWNGQYHSPTLNK